MTTDEDESRQVIDGIRRQYGIKSDGTQADDFAFISRGYRNAITQLSTGLYSEDTHFILELIQNAEDNEYLNKSPELRFVVLDDDPTNTPGSEGCLCVFNNEVGFDKSNVESICQIGESTKTKKQGYIGEKGIGFKSVFIVSEAPHIYSNGYRFKFKEKDPDIELSYIVPYWLENLPEIVKKDASNTAILLPLKLGRKSNIVNDLRLIKPETILFLSKLEGLSLDIRDEAKVVDLVRDQSGAPVIELLVHQQDQETSLNRYWLHHETVNVPASLIEEKRKEVVDRKISIAFPLEGKGRGGTVYAFLPTEVDCGLPFLINADFILTANRESIQLDKSWNKWIRDELADVIVKGLEAVSESQTYRKSMYGFIPLADEITSLKEYFQLICKQVHTQLSTKEIVLADCGRLIKPITGRQANKVVRKLFADKVKPAAFNDFNFVDVSIEKYANQLKAIGVSSFSDADLIICLSDGPWLSNKNNGWFVELYKYLQSSLKTYKAKLKTLSIIPVQGGENVSSKQYKVFLPLKRGVTKNLSKKIATAGFPQIHFIRQAVYDQIAGNNELIGWLKERFGISRFSIATYVISTLVPWLYEHADEVDENALMIAVGLIFDNWSEITDEGREIIKKKLPVLLDDGSVVRPNNRKGHELLVPRAFDAEKGWQLILKSEDDYGHQDVLSDKYLSVGKLDKEQLEEFFSAIQAQTFPDLHENTFSRRDIREIEDEYVLKVFQANRVDYTRSPSLTTWMVPSFFLKEGQRKNKKNRIAFLHWLNAMKDYSPKKLKEARMSWYYRTNKERRVKSGLYFYISYLPWINTSNGIKRPGEVFVPTKQIKEMFGNKLAYLKDDISSELCEFLGIKTEVNTETILEYLRELSGQPDVNFDLVIQLYRYLDNYGNGYAEPFSEEPLIYIPGTKKNWFTVNEVIWDDNSAALGELYGWLSSVYGSSKLEKFFLEKIEVSKSVKNQDLANAWLNLPKRDDLKPDNIEAALTKIYPRLLEEASSSDTLPLWWADFVNGVQVWTQDDQFVRRKDVYVPDDTNLRNLFSKELSFTWKPKDLTHKQLEALYSELGIALLTESVEVSLENPGTTNELESPIFLSSHSKRLLCYLLYNVSPEKYRELTESDVLKELLQSEEVTTDSLSIRYKVTGRWAHKVTDDQRAYWDAAKHLLYLQSEADKEDLRDDAVEVIARALWGISYKRYEDNVRTTLEVKTEDRFKKLRDKKGWHLPPEVLKEVNKLIGETGQHSFTAEEDISEATTPSSGPTEVADTTQTKSSKGGTGQEATTSQSGRSGQKSGAQRGSSTGQRHGSGQPGTGNNRRPGQSGSKPGHARTPGGRSRSRFSRSQGIASSVNQARRGPLLSNVASGLHNELDAAAGALAAEARRELGKIGELEVAEDLRAKGYKVTRMPDGNKGYDLEVVDPTTSELIYIEVKGDSFDWSDKGVGISPAQYKFGLEKGSSFYLAVVENLRSAPRAIYYIQDPVRQITQYRFDSGWAGLSTSIKSVVPGSASPGKSVKEQLIELTESDACRKIIEYCDDQGYPYPEVGTELVDDNDRVIFENIELAWEQENIGVLLTQEEKEIAQDTDEDWVFYFADEIDEILEQLDRLFNSDMKREL